MKNRYIHRIILWSFLLTRAELALLGCYAYMTSTSAYGQHFQEIPVSGAGFSWSQRNGSDGIVSLQSLSSDGLISTTWNGMYKVISETNAFWRIWMQVV